MNEQKKDRPAGATAQRSVEVETLRTGQSISEANYNIFSESRQVGAIEKALIQIGAFGEVNGVKMGQLQVILGLSLPRQVHQVMAEERLSEAPILSSTKGLYFLPSHDEATARQELEAYRRTLRSRALSTLRLITPVNRALRKMPEQTGPLDGG